MIQRQFIYSNGCKFINLYNSFLTIDIDDTARKNDLQRPAEHLYGIAENYTQYLNNNFNKYFTNLANPIRKTWRVDTSLGAVITVLSKFPNLPSVW